MCLETLDSLSNVNPRRAHPAYDTLVHARTSGNQGNLRSFSPNSARVNATLDSEYYSHDKYTLEFTSKDGDTVTLSMESIRYQRAMFSIDAEGSPEDMQKLIDYIKEEYSTMRHNVLKEFAKTLNGDIEDMQKTPEAATVEALDIPEYWNAENTSQRIVDFALQFFDGFTGTGEDFVKRIMDAIEKGFKDAKEWFGDLPDPVAELIEDTYDLVMRKIDAWATGKGITVSKPEEEGVLAEMEPLRAAA